MHILIFHGYLLGGTGSNVYNARLAEALVRLGHEVHLLAQERHPDEHPFVDAAGDWDSGVLRIAALKEGPVRCTLYRPAIGDLLPVYIEDRYEGLQARAFPSCSDAEVERYLCANVAAVTEVCELARPDIALANHLVMGPVVLGKALRGRVPYAVKIHGSALEYTVKASPERFLPYAKEGLQSAHGVIVGSAHTAESLRGALGREWVMRHRLDERMCLGPPGVDVHAFAPRPRQEAQAGLQRLACRLTGADQGKGSAESAEAASPEQGEVAAWQQGQAAAQPAHAFARDDHAAGVALAHAAAAQGPLVAYVGKLIVSKGVDLLLAAWPLVLQQVDRATLLVVGFGSLRGPLEGLLKALGEGDLEAVERLAHAGRALEDGPADPLDHLLSFLRSLHAQGRERYLASAAEMPQRVHFVGRLDHAELVDVLPACEALVVPSTFPEAFGMVAAEAAACGALPVSAQHSGLAEVSAALAQAVPKEVAPLLSFELGPHAVEDLAARITEWLATDGPVREAARAGIVKTVRARWSWEGVAEGVIASASGAMGADVCDS